MYAFCFLPCTFYLSKFMTAILTDLCENIVISFIDSFQPMKLHSIDDTMLTNFVVLWRYKPCRNWKKCNFMVNKGIVLEHKTLVRCIWLDKAEVEAIIPLVPIYGFILVQFPPQRAGIIQLTLKKLGISENRSQGIIVIILKDYIF